jgi:hypothetical protein
MLGRIVTASTYSEETQINYQPLSYRHFFNSEGELFSGSGQGDGFVKQRFQIEYTPVSVITCGLFF